MQQLAVCGSILWHLQLETCGSGSETRVARINKIFVQALPTRYWDQYLQKGEKKYDAYIYTKSFCYLQYKFKHIIKYGYFNIFDKFIYIQYIPACMKIISEIDKMGVYWEETIRRTRRERREALNSQQ
jgi:hypothetical protein